MTDSNAIPANDTDLPKYLQSTQDKAMRLRGIMAAIATLVNENKCTEGQVTLIYLAEELSLDLANALDCVSIPKGVVS